MKILLLLPVIVLSFTMQAQTIYPGGVHDCVARWDFSPSGVNGILTDASNNGNNGIANNLTSTTGCRNLPNTAMAFDGASSYAMVPHNAKLVPQQMTMIAVVKLTGLYSGLCQVNEIVGKGDPYFVDGSYHLAIADDDGDCNAFNPNDEQLGTAYGNATSFLPTIPPSSNLSLNVWYFLASSYDGNTYKEYLEVMGQNSYVTKITPIVNVTGANTLIGVNTQDLYMGHVPDPTFPYWFNGAMDEVAIFNRPLADSEIQTVYNYMWGFSAGVNNVSAKQDIRIFPNPASDHVTIESSEPVSAKISSMDGRLLMSVNNAKQLNISALSPGVYIIAIYSEDGMLLKSDKLIK